MFIVLLVACNVMKTITFMLHLFVPTSKNIFFSMELLTAFYFHDTFYWGPWSWLFSLKDNYLVVSPKSNSEMKCYEIHVYVDGIMLWFYYSFYLYFGILKLCHYHLNIWKFILRWANLFSSRILFVARIRYLNLSKKKHYLKTNFPHL